MDSDSGETFSDSDLVLGDSNQDPDLVQPRSRSNRVSTEFSSEDESRSSTSTPVSVTNTSPRSRSRPTPTKRPRVAGHGAAPVLRGRNQVVALVHRVQT